MSRSELSTSQELYYAFSTHKLLFLQVSVDWNPNISNVMCPLKKTFPLWRTGVGYVGALFIPHACLQLGGYNSRHSIRGGSPITSKVSVSQSPLNSHEWQSRLEVESSHYLFEDQWYLCSLSDAMPMPRSQADLLDFSWQNTVNQ